MAKEIIITGCGLVGNFGAGKVDFSDFILRKKAGRKIGDFNIDDYIDMNILRRADINSCFASIAAKLAIDDAELSIEKVSDERLGLVLASTHGPLAYTQQYHKELVTGNPQLVSPTLFSNSMVSSMVNYISMIFCIRGYTTTLTGYNSVLQSIQCGMDLIKDGLVDVCLVGGVDIFDDILIEAYSHCIDNSRNLSDNFGGSGILVLESYDSARLRNKNGYAQVLGADTITADYSQLDNSNISPINRLLRKSQLNIRDIDCVMTSCYSSETSRRGQELCLQNFRENIATIDCLRLFGYTFSAGEIFKVILAALSLKEEFPLSEISEISSNRWPFSNILVSSVMKTGASGCLILAKDGK